MLCVTWLVANKVEIKWKAGLHTAASGNIALQEIQAIYYTLYIKDQATIHTLFTNQYKNKTYCTVWVVYSVWEKKHLAAAVDSESLCTKSFPFRNDL